MDALMKYLESIGSQINTGKSELSEGIPFKMREFYEKIKNVELPFGYIFDVETAIKISKGE